MIRQILINPVYIGSIVFFLCFVLGKFNYEGNVPNYNITILYMLFFVLGGATAGFIFNIDKRLKYQKNFGFRKLPKLLHEIFLAIYCLAIFVSLLRLFLIFKLIINGYDLRFIEYNVRTGGAIASMLVQILPIVAFYILLTSDNKKRIIFLSILTTICCFAIPIKTHIISSLLIIYLALVIKSNSLTSVLLTSIKVFFFVLFFLFITIYLRSPDQTFDLIIDKLWLTFRQYTSFNLANLALELNSSMPLTSGLHTFSQIIDLSHFLTYGERFIDRNIGNSGLNSVVDGRKLLVLSRGTNMSTAIRPWVWDFGAQVAFLVSYLYGFFLVFLAYVSLITRFYSFYGISYLCGFFYFWDFDLFEIRFQFIYLLFFMFLIIAYVLNLSNSQQTRTLETHVTH